MPAAKPLKVLTAEEAAINSAFKLARRQLGTLNSAETVHLRELLQGGTSVAEAVSAIRQARYAPNPLPVEPEREVRAAQL